MQTSRLNRLPAVSQERAPRLHGRHGHAPAASAMHKHPADPSAKQEQRRPERPVWMAHLHLAQRHRSGVLTGAGP
eukprot:16447157-Heterocapsa_arctica.AAC.1